MKASIKDITISLEGEVNATLSLPPAHLQELKKLQNELLEVNIKKWRKGRSSDANALMWALCRDIGRAMKPPISDKEVYRKAILDVGEYMPVPVKEDAVDALRERWKVNGIGWLLEVEDDSKLKGYKRVRLYYGSSTYTTEEMSRLLDYLIDDAQQMGIVLPATPEQIEQAKRMWGAESVEV